MNYLIIVAHPDDEVLGAGGLISKATQTGNSVDIHILSANVQARANRPSTSNLFADLKYSSKILGIRKTYTDNFPNIEFNNVPHLKLVQSIEKVIAEAQPDIIITHHPSDTNNDHLETSLACQEAMRLFLRRANVKPVSEFWYMEVLSATDWSLNTSMNRFMPNTYIEIGENGVETKIEALSKYRGVMREFPHPRSNEALRGLAAYRGGQAGLKYAEAFECVLRSITLQKMSDDQKILLFNKESL